MKKSIIMIFFAFLDTRRFYAVTKACYALCDFLVTAAYGAWYFGEKFVKIEKNAEFARCVDKTTKMNMLKVNNCAVKVKSNPLYHRSAPLHFRRFFTVLP